MGEEEGAVEGEEERLGQGGGMVGERCGGGMGEGWRDGEGRRRSVLHMFSKPPRHT